MTTALTMKSRNPIFVFKSIVRITALMVTLFNICPGSSFAQSADEISALVRNTAYGEELQVRTDRELYIAGEKVLLNLFCFTRLTRENPGISMVAYISLLDNVNNPVLQIKIRINGLTGSGSFTLPDSLSSGNYYLAACTHWMRNFSPELFSYRCISVINPFRNTGSIEMPLREPEADTVFFYPESGKSIAGAEIAMGFRCLGKNLDPVEVKGVIIDSSNRVICHIQSGADGYGLFSINLHRDGPLYFKPADDSLLSRGFTLPPAGDSGIALSVTEDRGEGIFSIRLAGNRDFITTGKKCRLVYAPVSLAPLVLDIDPVPGHEITLKQNSLPAGLALISLMDDTGRRYAERWVYNDRTRLLNFTVSTDKQDYATREKVKISIAVADSVVNPAECNLMVLVARRYTLSETAGYTEGDLQKAGLPAINNKTGIRGIQDQLVFMQPADDMIFLPADRPAPLYLPEPDGHIISGVISGTANGEPLRKEPVVFSVVGKTARCRFTRTDEDGRFVFVSPGEGMLEIVIQPMSADPGGYYVELDNPFPEAFSRLTPPVFSIDTAMLEMLNHAVISMQVSRMYESSMPSKPVAPYKSCGKDFFGVPVYTVQMSKFIQLASLREVIKEIVTGAVTTVSKGKTIINTIEKHGDYAEIRNPLVIVDGVPVFDHEKALDIKVNKIEKIDVVNTRYYVSGIALDGIINITTYDGDLTSVEFDNPLFRQEFEAPLSGSGFTSPDYSEPLQKESRIPDFRNTLYWDPAIKTDKNGRATAEFYTSDEPGDYTVLVEGFMADGRRGTATCNLSVKSSKEGNGEFK